MGIRCNTAKSSDSARWHCPRFGRSCLTYRRSWLEREQGRGQAKRANGDPRGGDSRMSSKDRTVEQDDKDRQLGIGELPDGTLNVVSRNNPELIRRLAKMKAREEAEVAKASKTTKDE